jgi:hypothetical protein
VTELSVAATARPRAERAAYSEDLAPGMQDELSALADIESRFEGVLGGDVRRQRLEAWRAKRRKPHVLRLAQLHQRMMAVTLHRQGRVPWRG